MSVAAPGAAAQSASSPSSTSEAPPAISTCPAELPSGTHCYSGADGQGALYLAAVPANWNGVLVLHAHGGPELGPPKLERSVEDLKRWAVVVRAGYAWAGSTYRRGGYGVTMAAEDTERLRQLFVAHIAHPRRTILHGQSYGGNVAAKEAELYAKADNGKSPYDGLLLTSGVIGGGTHSYDARLDLRVVYELLCNNHPAADEPHYPLWRGLPKDSTLTHAQLATRMNECLGLNTPAAQRTEAQRSKLVDLLGVVKLPERTLVSHMNWATWLFQDMVQNRLDGRNPFGNDEVVYQGSHADAALNANVLRYRADPEAVAKLAADSDLTGDVHIPTVTLHAIDDPTAVVELESVYRATRERAGTADLLVQTYSDEHEHSYLSDSEYVALLASLMAWIDDAKKPSPQSIAERCMALDPAHGEGCKLRPDYVSAPLDTRVPARKPR